MRVLFKYLLALQLSLAVRSLRLPKFTWNTSPQKSPVGESIDRQMIFAAKSVSNISINYRFIIITMICTQELSFPTDDVTVIANSCLVGNLSFYRSQFRSINPRKT